MGGKAPARTTLADANRQRSADFFVALLLTFIGCVNNRINRRQLKSDVRLIDATHVDLGPRMERWFSLYQGRAAAKIHGVYDPAAQRPVYFALTEARMNDIPAAKDLLPIEPGATYVFDLGYYDFAWWAALAAASCVFVTRLKSNTQLRDATERAVPPSDVVLSDREGYLPKRLAHNRRNPFGQKGREIVIRIDNGKILRLFTNDLTSPAEEIAALYKERWQIELFFKWIKQNLRITKFMGTSENAIRTQIAVAFIAYLLVRLMQDSQTEAAQIKVPPPAAAAARSKSAKTKAATRAPAADGPKQMTCRTPMGQARPSQDKGAPPSRPLLGHGDAPKGWMAHGAGGVSTGPGFIHSNP